MTNYLPGSWESQLSFSCLRDEHFSDWAISQPPNYPLWLSTTHICSATFILGSDEAAITNLWTLKLAFIFTVSPCADLKDPNEVSECLLGRMRLPLKVFQIGNKKKRNLGWRHSGWAGFFCCLARLRSEELIYMLGQNPRRKEFVNLLGRKRTLVAGVLLGYGSEGRAPREIWDPQNSDGNCSEWQGHDRKRSSGAKVGLEIIIWGDGSVNKVSSRKHEELSWGSSKSVQLPSVRDKGLCAST